MFLKCQNLMLILGENPYLIKQLDIFEDILNEERPHFAGFKKQFLTGFPEDLAESRMHFRNSGTTHFFIS